MEVEQSLRTLTADEPKFKQIMYNLLSNAIKFTPVGGTVRVTAQLIREGGEQQPGVPGHGGDEWCRFSIRDTGIGIRPEDRERIFEEFEQAGSASAQNEPGTGLGLALTRRLVELHGGRIWVESEGEGKGSTFVFLLPAASDAANTRPAALPEEAPQQVPDGADDVEGSELELCPVRPS
jgi:signal transduction histidine kinase